jgi:segregation and condensation protein A
MHYWNSHLVSLDNFEGPIELLIYLAQKQELSVYDISIQEIIKPFIKVLEASIKKDCINKSSEFISHLASLMLFKSKFLLPSSPTDDSSEQEEIAYPLEAIQHLLEYCQYKGLSEKLAQRFEEQQTLILRGSPEIKDLPQLPSPPMKAASLEELSSLFSDILKQANSKQGAISKETWRVKDKVRFVKQQLKLHQNIMFHDLFPIEKSRLELIVTFLALLELLKQGFVELQKQEDLSFVCLVTHKESCVE